MHKITFIFSLLALSQLTGCVGHRQYSNDMVSRPYSTGYTAYQTQYPQQYDAGNYDQSTYQTLQSNDQTNYQDPYQSQSEVAQIVGIRQIGQVARRNDNNGGGAVIGAILGGIIGNQLGRGNDHSSYRSREYGHRRYDGYERRQDSGDGRVAATLGGAILGGVIGNEIDRSSSNNETQVRTEITLRLGNGAVRSVLLENARQFRVGDRVRVGLQAGRWVIL